MVIRVLVEAFSVIVKTDGSFAALLLEQDVHGTDLCFKEEIWSAIWYLLYCIVLYFNVLYYTVLCCTDLCFMEEIWSAIWSSCSANTSPDLESELTFLDTFSSSFSRPGTGHSHYSHLLVK